jgi:signal transduction histidine kinase
MQAATGLADVHVAAFKLGRRAAAMLSAAPGIQVLPFTRAGSAAQAYLVGLETASAADLGVLLASARVSGAVVIGLAPPGVGAGACDELLGALDGVLRLPVADDDADVLRHGAALGARLRALVSSGRTRPLTGHPGVITWELDPATRCFSNAGGLMTLLGCDAASGRLSVAQFHDVVRRGERHAVKACLESAVDRDEAVSLSFRIAKANGAGVPIAMYGAPSRDGTGRFAGIAFAIDHALHAELDELRTADRCKNEFIAMMAHELRNPLAAILGAGELVAKTAPSDTGLAAAGAALRRQTQHLSRLIDELRNIGYTGLARGTPDMCACRFEDILRDAVEQVAPRISARAHRFVVESDGHGQLVDGNFTQLVQVVANLLNNAAKYTPDGGTIRLRVDTAGERLRCVISDSGIGMTAEFIERAFDPFVQAEAGRARADGGIGLGLKLVRELAAIHGGSVHAHSGGAGRGSAFVLELPVLTACRPHAG